MSYRMATYREEDGRLFEDFSQNSSLFIEETEKAVLTFEADMLVCRLFIVFTNARFGERASQIRSDLRERNELPEDVRSVLDEVFEDILTYIEFYENRMTTQGDPAITRLMVHVRFSAAYLLRIDYSRSDYHKHARSNKKMNSALFRHDSRDEIEDIYHLDYNKDLKKSITSKELDIRLISESLGSKQNADIRAYYDRILSDIEGKKKVFYSLIKQEEADIWRKVVGDNILYFRDNPYVPLFMLVEKLTEQLPKLYRQYSNLDYKDMIHNNIRVMAPALGKITNRENNLNAAQKTPLEITKIYGREMIEKEIMYTRILDAIVGCSAVDQKKLDFRFSLKGAIRLLDPRLFGWRYNLPPIIFCMDSEDLYNRFMKNYEKVTSEGVVHANWIKIAQSQWTNGKRMKAGNRVSGGIFKFDKIEYVSPKRFVEHMKQVKEPTTIVTTVDRMDEMVSYLCSYTTVAEKNRIGSVFVVSPIENFIFPGTIIPYTSIILLKGERLMDALTLHNVRLIELAVGNYLSMMAADMEVPEEAIWHVQPVDLRTALYWEFVNQVKNARHELNDTRKLMDLLE